VKRLHDDEKLTYRAIATQLGSNFSSVRRAYLRALEPVPMHANAPDRALVHVDAPDGAVMHAIVPPDISALQERITAFETQQAHLQQGATALECFVTSLQHQRLSLQQQLASNGQPCTTVHATVHGASMHAHARFDDPADAQSVRWNLTLPRGLKRRLQKQAKALGIDETKRVQALLWRGLEAEEAAQ
jgi:hypothetical protein